MTGTQPEYFSDLEQFVDALLDMVGKEVVIAGGFGRPAHIFNELFRRAMADPTIKLTMITGASFGRPSGKSDLEKRFMDPFVDRVFGNLPDLDYVKPYTREQLPPNIEIVEDDHHLDDPQFATRVGEKMVGLLRRGLKTSSKN